MGNIDRPRLALDLVGEVVRRVQGTTLLTVATRAPAVLGDLHQARRQDGLVRGQIGQTAVQHAADESGVLRDTHDEIQQGDRANTRIRIMAYPKKTEKPGREESFSIAG